MYYNGCKYARSTNPNKFKLSGTNDRDAEASVEDFCQRLATIVGSVYKKTAPDAHRNQVRIETFKLVQKKSIPDVLISTFTVLYP